MQHSPCGNGFAVLKNSIVKRLYKQKCPCKAGICMRVHKQVISLFAVILLSGCSTTITNLTPRHQSRNSAGAYPVEIVFNSNLKAIKPETIRPYVQVGNENYLMRKTPTVKDRWETLIPVPSTEAVINYQVKVDFRYDSVPDSKPNSALSPAYQLRITE